MIVSVMNQRKAGGREEKRQTETETERKKDKYAVWRWGTCGEWEAGVARASFRRAVYNEKLEGRE